MRWLNSCYIKELSVHDFRTLAQPFYKSAEYLGGYDLDYLSALLKDRCELLSDVVKLTAFLNEFDGFDLDLFVNQKWKTDRALAKRLLPALIALTESDFAGLHDGLVALAECEGLKKGQVLWIYRIALTGAQNTPVGATEMAELLGKERATERLRATLARL